MRRFKSTLLTITPNRTGIHMANENAQAALDDAKVLLELAPGLALAKLRKAEANMMLSNWKRAKDDLEQIVEDAPTTMH